MAKYTRQQIVETFKSLHIDIYPAGRWKMVNGRKEPIVAYRQDYQPLDKFKDDNMYKLRAEDHNVIVIDLDAPSTDIVSMLMQNMPTLAQTFTTTTTNPNKQHIYIKRPEEFPITRIVGAWPKVDVLSNGIVFEGHLHDVNEHYDMENTTILELKPREIDFLMSIVPTSTLNKKHNQEANKRFAPYEKQIIEDYIADKLDDKRRLWKLLTPKDKADKNRTYTCPPLAYDTFNTIAYYLALNEYIPHQTVISFLEHMLVKEYNINLNSKETQTRLYKQIIPTLPIYEIDDYNENFDAHMAKAPISRTNQHRVISTIDNSGALKYILVDKYTYVPIVTNDTILRGQKSLAHLFPTLNADTWTFGIPFVEITSNPYAPRISYDLDRDLFTLSMIVPTQYILNIGAVSQKPNNVLTKAISKIFEQDEDSQCSVDPEDFYYHWLAHILFSTKQLSTVMSLSTASNVQGGTGKSTFTAKLPMHILPRGMVKTIDEETAKWGDAFHNTKLTCFDDLHDTKHWSELYARIKRETSGTIKAVNQKGGSITISDKSACIAVSSNFYPKVDETDRRFFIWAPTEKLTDEEGLVIAEIMSDYTVYRQEIQDIANYCFHLFTSEQDKYYRELYIEAPTTSFLLSAKTDGTTSEKLISMIMAGPNILFDAFVPGKNNYMSKHEIVEFILEQLKPPTSRTQGKWTTLLPQDFFRVLLNATRDEDMTNLSPKNIAFRLGNVVFSSLSKQDYRDKAKYAKWATRGLSIKLSDKVIKSYQDWLKYNKEDIAPSEEAEI